VNTLGIDPPKISTTNYQLPPLRQGFAGRATTNYILYVGQAFPRRHLRETILAFEQLVSPSTNYSLPPLRQDFAGQATTNLCLIAIGKDKYNPQIIKKITADINRRLGREGIIYKEYVPEDKLCQLYANAKLLIYVSSKEAFGLPPLEALAYGVPAVVADEQINHEIYGENSFFASPVRGRLSTKTTASSNGTGAYTAETIAEAIKDGLTNESKRQKIKNARESILQKYTWQKHTNRFLEIIRTFAMKKAAQ
jgi:glycosyltransferase involved in cell wall biosynthesis